MKSTKILIALEHPNMPLEMDSSISISMLELKEWILSGKIFKYLFHFRKSIVYAYRHELIDRPFIKFFAIWLISYGPSFIKDRFNNSIRITIPLLCKFFFEHIKEICLKPLIHRQTLKMVRSLINKTIPLKKLDLAGIPVYLRTNNCLGLTAGGSVAHTAGVVNNLGNFTADPIYISPHILPSIDDEIEKYEVIPESKYRAISHLRYLQYNEVLFEKTKQLLKNKKPAFIYQRYSIESYSGVLLSNFFKIPFVLEYNGSEIWLSNEYGTPTINAGLWESIEYVNLLKADLIVVVSTPLKDQLIKRGMKEEKILVNPNGVDTEIYSPAVDGSQIRSEFELNNKLVFGFIGTFGGWHGAEILAEAFARLITENPQFKDTVRLMMVGDGLKWKNVKEIIANNNIEDQSILTGLVPQEQGPNYLAACDFLVSPHVPNPDGTPFFGSPTKLFEYMAMGKGIIASDLDQIGEILNHNKTAIMVKPGDPDDLKVAIKFLINDPTFGEKLGLAAREEAIDKHTWKEHTAKIIQKLDSLYN
jgi:glycosyltransferase involved in cell wall biosynthesis